MDRAPAKEGDLGVGLEARVAGSREELGLVWDSDSELNVKAGRMLWYVGRIWRERNTRNRAAKSVQATSALRAPSPDTADQKLMREITEYVMLKRSRMEQMNALKKERNAKTGSGSSSGNAIALVFTMLFIFIMLFHGCSPSLKPSVTSFEGSPKSAGFHDKDSISSRYGPIMLASYDHGPSYGSTPSSTEEVADERLSNKQTKAFQ
ncbi:hypothetical protein MLD38_010735 [Melastoma candidum]|uniref:Uncharacterized protein n=1 Tax=Melastoma candidum TaxID=119954 RepID=A0ACB9R1D0_9MYRT|nr:hypothetical protein MLD38_010735 [Melastoma candidum]